MSRAPAGSRSGPVKRAPSASCAHGKRPGGTRAERGGITRPGLPGHGPNAHARCCRAPLCGGPRGRGKAGRVQGGCWGRSFLLAPPLVRSAQAAALARWRPRTAATRCGCCRASGARFVSAGGAGRAAARPRKDLAGGRRAGPRCRRRAFSFLAAGRAASPRGGAGSPGAGAARWRRERVVCGGRGAARCGPARAGGGGSAVGLGGVRRREGGPAGRERHVLRCEPRAALFVKRRLRNYRCSGSRWWKGVLERPSVLLRLCVVCV